MAVASTFSNDDEYAVCKFNHISALVPNAAANSVAVLDVTDLYPFKI